MTGRKIRLSSLFAGFGKPDSTASPSSPQKLPDHAKRIREAAEAVDEERVDADLDALFDYISRISDFIKEKEKEKKKKKRKRNNLSKPDLLVSNTFLKLKDALSEAIEAAKDFASGEAQTIARGFLKDMGTARVVNIGFLVVANAWERYEAMSANQNECMSLLKEMSKLEQHVKELQKRPQSKRGMEASIRQAIELIIEASIACCTQIEASKTSSFFSATSSKEKLAELEKKLQQTYRDMQNQMGVCILDAVNQPKPHYPKYPEDKVGIEEPLQEVIKKLEWESDKNAVAVILHGFGGMGKTTLADAVFARLFEEKKEGCKFSFVSLFQDIKSTPNVVELQKIILFDLKGEKAEDIRRYNEGQEEIGAMLEKEEVFIYIDNVLLPDKREQGPDALTKLLPENMGNAKKVRLLITARNKDAASWMTMSKGVEKEFYPIQSLPEPKAVELLKKELSANKNQLNARQINEIVNICGGVPGLLKVLAGFINGGEGNAAENYKTLMKEAKGKNWKGDIGESIEQYVFAYDKLEDKWKDPFLDICSFFRGWDWKELSDIVGETALKRLEQRALVTRDVKSMTARVHDVILEVGLQRAQGNRFRLTTATEIEKFLEVEDLPKIKGIWASDNKDPLRIPAKKLDLMSRSLRVLKLGPLSGVEGKCENKFEELRFFSAITSRLPFDVSKLKGFEKLRHLCYNPEDLQNLCQMPSSLRYIEFELNSPPFQISSKCIQQLNNLRVLRLTNAQFKSLPKELGDLGNGNLEELSLESCQYLEKLPASLSSLGSLTVLRMPRCSGLTQLPEDLGSLNCLQELSLQECKSLEVLPSELENLTALQKLDLSSCTRLKALPRSLGKLTSLQQLGLSWCTCLKALPSSLEELSSLRLLDLSYCKIKDLPSGLEKLTSLVILRLFRCYELSSIPGSIGQLKLNSISLREALKLKELPDGFCNFSTLTELDMGDCIRLEKLPERFGEVTSLRKLKLDRCGSLQKMPESFCQLKYLEHLDLSFCRSLEELCKDFKGLSLLRVLSLEYCNKLKKLPEDFQCLISLEDLDVRYCSKLEGKWIDSMLKMKTLQILRIEGSELLEERWEEIQAQQCNQSLSCGVYTKQGLSNEENLLKQFQSEFVSMLTNGEGKPLNISGRPLNTLLLVMFDDSQDFCPDSFPLPLLEESIDDIQTHFEMVYFGNHWDQLPKKVADRILGHAPANRDTIALFQRLFSSVVQFSDDFDRKLAISFHTSSFQMTAEFVNGENGDKYLSRWKYFSDYGPEEMEVEDFVVTKCGRYLKLKQVAERGGGSPIALLRELFAGGEEEISVSFLKNKDGESTKVGVDELQGKTIFLDMRPGNNSFDISLHALVEMYNVEKERFNFEIITVPIMQEDTTLDVSEKFSREVPWLVLQNPWQLTNTTKYFLIEGCPRWLDFPREWWYPKIMRIIESNGTFAPYNDQKSVLRMLHTWGAAAFPFTAEKEEELIEKEKTQMEAIPHAIFLFQHLERVSEQLREPTGQQKMICLCCCRENDFPNSMKDVLTELSKIIYIIYIPYFWSKETLKYEHFTYAIYQARAPLEPSKMSSAGMERMFSLSLSEYEAIRFWARIRSLKEGIKATDQIQLSEMLSIMISGPPLGNSSWMFIMNEDGNLITTQGEGIVKLLSEKYEIVKLLSERYSDDRVKELMQQLLKGTYQSWKKTLLELEEML